MPRVSLFSYDVGHDGAAGLVQVGRGLIQEEQPRPVQMRLGVLEPLAHAAGVRTHQIVAPARQAHPLQQAAKLLAPPGPGRARGRRRPGSPRAVSSWYSARSGPTRPISRPAVGRAPAPRRPVHHGHRPRRRPGQPAQHPQQRALAGPVGAGDDQRTARRAPTRSVPKRPGGDCIAWPGRETLALASTEKGRCPPRRAGALDAAASADGSDDRRGDRRVPRISSDEFQRISRNNTRFSAACQ